MSHNVKISRNKAILLLHIMRKVQDVSNVTGHTNINTIDTWCCKANFKINPPYFK